MGGLFSSSAPKADPAAYLADKFKEVFETERFLSVFDVFVGENGLVQVSVLFSDGTIQSWGSMFQVGGKWVSGPRFSKSDNTRLESYALTVKVRQQGAGIDSSNSSALENAFKHKGIPIDLRVGHKYMCTLVEKARLLTGSTKESFEEC